MKSTKPPAKVTETKAPSKSTQPVASKPKDTAVPSKTTIPSAKSTQTIERKTGAYNSSYNGSSGQGLGKLVGKELNVSEKGLKIVKEHLSENFGDYPENLAMIKRLENALANKQKISGADASFYLHEVSESTMMKKGVDYDTAHEMAIKKYNVSPFSVYHADVIKSMPDIFNKNWRKFWGLDE
ncbi:hypothetical protein ACOMCU_09035 [Lysinibacillus sp. UGB7]|uniref:hypothetical protein n=1 Tax=Lysinibacillus sp. UGB7 TaxID=3411039 RepID=UPI003B7EBE07